MNRTGMKTFACSALFVAGLALAPGLASAAQYWNVKAPNEVPWTSAVAVASFNDQLFVSGWIEVQAGTVTLGIQPRLWKSADSKTWELVRLPEEILFTSLHEFNGFIYGFGQIVRDGFVMDFHQIYRASEDLSFVRVDGFTPLQEAGTWTDSIVGGSSWIIAADNKRKMYWSDGEGESLVWNPVNFPLGSCGGGCNEYLHLALSNDFLYAAYVRESFGRFTTNVYRTQDMLNWSYMGGNPAQQNEMIRPGFVYTGGRVYWGGDKFWTITEVSPYDVSWDSSLVGTRPTPFQLEGNIHVYLPSDQVLMRADDGSWQSVFQANPPYCSASSPRYSRPAVLGNTTYILPCDLMSLTRGIHKAKRDDLILGSLRAEQKNAVGLGFSVEVNFIDKLKRLTVENLGTADQNEIERVSLMKIIPGAEPGQASSQLIAVLNPVAGEKKWTTSSGFPGLDVRDGNKFVIAVDISANPRDKTTCRLSIPRNGFEYELRPNYAPDTALSAPEAQQIQANPPPPSVPPAPPAAPEPEPIEKVVVYPSPAKDKVRFLYTLPSRSDVVIGIYDREGIRIEELRDLGKPAAARATTIWDASRAAPGVYYAVIRIRPESSGERVYKNKIVIEK